MARFKSKFLQCKKCSAFYKGHEEKETDVAIAAKVFDLLKGRTCKTIVVVSGDTDLLPAIRTARSLYPRANIGAILPYKRHNNEVAGAVHFSFKASVNSYQRAQLPDPIIAPSGAAIHKPTDW